MKERIAYLDVVKCFAIALVCIGHSSWVSPRGMTCPLVRWIYTFHMPLFMLMCGFFSKGLFELSVRDFAVKELKRIVVPIVVFTGLKIGLLTLVGADVWKSELIGGMWFLRCLLFCDIIVYVGKKLCGFDWVVCILTCVVLFVVPYGTFLRTNYFLLLYWTGYFWRRYYEMYERNVLWITIAALVICAVVGITGEPPIVTWNELDNLLKYYCAGVGWSVAIIGLMFYICSRVDMSLYATIGTETLAIYCINSLLGDGLVRECVKWRCATVFDWVFILGLGITELVICFYVFVFYQYLYVNFRKVQIKQNHLF